MTEFHRFIPISKIDKKRQMCWGYASTPTLDLDGEIITLDAMKDALPDYMTWANIREQHKSDSAVGVAKEANVDHRGLWLGAKIVDKTAWEKVEEGVYKGFSVGGSILEKKGNTIHKMQLIEISIVDRPANPDCRIEMIKGVKPADEKAVIPLTVDDWSDMPLVLDRDETTFLKRLMKFFKAGDGLSSPAGEVVLLPGEGVHHADRIEQPGNFPAPGDQSKAVHEDGLPEGDEKAPAGKKPYGDVHYADPGYQADGKHRYPIDTEAHIRSAWSYIHKPKNRKPYNPAQITHIENSIAAAWRSIIGGDGPTADKAATVDWDALVEKAAANDALFKSMYDVQDLASAFSQIRRSQRERLVEGKLEDDADDTAIAHDLGRVANQLAGLIARIATHEGNEALTLRDVDDIQSYRMQELGLAGPVITVEVSEKMADPTQIVKDAADLAAEALIKRSKSKAVHIGKAAHHLDECIKAQGAMHKCIKSLHNLHMTHAAAMKMATTEKSAPPEFDHSGALGHIHDMIGHHTKMADHHELAHSHITLAASSDVSVNGPGTEGWTSPIHNGGMPTQGDPLPDGQGPTAGKSAGMDAATFELLKKSIEEAAYFKGKSEALEKMPAAGAAHRPLSFDPNSSFDKSAAGGKDPMTMLLDGVDVTHDDPDSRAKAAGKMISNMISNANVFGKNPALDPNFRGGAGGSRPN